LCIEDLRDRQDIFWWGFAPWRKFLAVEESAADVHALRECTHSGRPLGSDEFTEIIEQSTHRRLTPQKGGRPRKPVGGANK
jgi:hypothetical protein